MATTGSEISFVAVMGQPTPAATSSLNASFADNADDRVEQNMREICTKLCALDFSFRVNFIIMGIR